MPSDLQRFRNHILKNKGKTFIIKPEASSQGRGIYLIKRVEDIKEINHSIAQNYLQNPFLIDGLKFDLRIYVLVAGSDPLKIFIHEEGIARFATQTYQVPKHSNLDEVYIHLTNYAINKNNPNFAQNDGTKHKDNEGHKRSLSSVLLVKNI